ncbi:MAG TPA: 7-carboxy-7-deazaguanine synthase QueE [Gemmatimonadetes bacterium]|nr:7-carboxy-7-deazaguanine synthase QueE [Gemmatimonadota bacterium]HBV05678.1 7-carboxy-7-deazaguanine synthase QueE [Gemmatimonadota bacterium]HCO13486.1 7-carboxy-7-deazaguanine synthase QueE [Gemmatimonadota bacterium]
MTEQFLRISEIFHSIQGESTWAGIPCTFVRVTGCPLRCSWCDTTYAFQGGTRMSFAQILEAVASFPTRIVELTGGEPLVHPGSFALTDELLKEGYTVLVETSGAFDISSLDQRVHKIMDLKCPGSEESEKNRYENLEHLTGRDEIKFVLQDREDYDWAKSAIQQYELEKRVENGTLGAILVSPVWGKIDLRELSQWILEDGLQVRFQVQVHKLIWGPEATGV